MRKPPATRAVVLLVAFIVSVMTSCSAQHAIGTTATHQPAATAQPTTKEPAPAKLSTSSPACLLTTDQAGRAMGIDKVFVVSFSPQDCFYSSFELSAELKGKTTTKPDGTINAVRAVYIYLAMNCQGDGDKAPIFTPVDNTLHVDGVINNCSVVLILPSDFGPDTRKSAETLYAQVLANRSKL
ncbi:MAG: hypothetical protein JWN01_1127 [Patescibacteria group bacterium]|nr:hypothetical protein [Patescibacteria group bacterium]